MTLRSRKGIYHEETYSLEAKLQKLNLVEEQITKQLEKQHGHKENYWCSPVHSNGRMEMYQDSGQRLNKIR